MTTRYAILVDGQLYKYSDNAVVMYADADVAERVIRNKKNMHTWDSAFLVTMHCDCEEEYWNEW